MTVTRTVATVSIPHFPRSTVEGHAGELILGEVSGRPVAVLSGRVHGYEGYPSAEVGFSARFLRALGCETLIVTNAAGSLNPAFRPGNLMLIEDHINLPALTGSSPLIGSVDAGLPRFVDMTEAYAQDLRRLAEEAAGGAGISIRSGVYVMVGGPNFETPAEVRYLRSLGGDAVGMSTASEVIVARQVGLRVLGLSVISNLAAGLPGARLRHEDVLDTVARSVPRVRQLVEGFLTRLPD